MPRIVVLGGPRTGKTTYATKLAKQLGVHLGSTGKRTEQEDGLVSTDNYMKRANWATLPDVIIKDLKDREDWVLEGTQAARVLRRWLKASPDEPKVDKVLVFGKPWVARTPGQEAMAKGVRTILRDLQPLLDKAGIEVEHMTPPELTPEERREKFSEAFEPEPPEVESVDLEAEPVQDT
jgi:hypothetical protein